MSEQYDNYTLVLNMEDVISYNKYLDYNSNNILHKIGVKKLSQILLSNVNFGINSNLDK